MTEKDFDISIRPEIRKGCLWDVQFMFSPKFLNETKLKELIIDKVQKGMMEHSAYLCLKVRSKLLYRELGMNKVCEIERNSIPINQESGVAVLKVKFTQRPRSVFHKHSDVMILVASVKSIRTNEVLAKEEVELVFRGGTGSCHSAESKKRKNSDRNEVQNIPSPQSFSHPIHPYSPSSQIHNPISPSPYIHDDETLSSSDDTDTYFPPIYSNNPHKKMCPSPNSQLSSDDLFPPFANFPQDDPFYLRELNDIHESMELIEWSKKEGLLNDDDLLLGNENLVEEMKVNGAEKLDVNEEIRKFKAEMMNMVNEKLESFKRRIHEKLMIEMGRNMVQI